VSTGNNPMLWYDCEDAQYFPIPVPVFTSMLWLWMRLLAVSVLACVLYDFECITAGNERSAEHGNNIEWGGREINHQYDKSAVFGRALRGYIRRYIDPSVCYFSPIEHLWELEVRGGGWERGRSLANGRR
jgi:hypothetical protein